ncbi:MULTISPECIES: glycosyltransferase family 4 protein [Sphingobacterium]|nr:MULTISPECIES: glycosyltransferase family 1 protein [unclassified Sphingobacterium]
MKYQHTGLYYFCLHLGKAVLDLCPEDKEFQFYLNRKLSIPFGSQAQYINQRSLHKFLKPRYEGVDLWHSTFQLSSYIPSDKKIKVVSTIHDLNFLKEDKSSQKRAKYLKKIQSLIDRSSSIIAISNYVKQDLLEHCELGEKTIQVIYNGCNIDENIHLRYENDIPLIPGEYIYSLGTIARKKNIHTLPYLLKGNNLKLVISGIVQEPDYLEYIKRIASSIGVAGRVFYTGPVTEREKLNYLKHCSIFAFPSIAEGFGLPVIEAMSLGRKVLLSTYTSLPEVGGPEAFYLEETSIEYMESFGKLHLEDILNGPNREEEIKGWTSQFSWKEAAKKYWTLYERLL